jgi:hypothetical protein
MTNMCVIGSGPHGVALRRTSIEEWIQSYAICYVSGDLLALDLQVIAMCVL